MNRSGIFILLTLIGVGITAFSLTQGNGILVGVAILFTFVSFYNIFCGMRKK